MMAELFEAIASWRSLLLVFVVFGFAPGFLLRLLVKIYPKNDPRRQELVAELYSLGRLERILFVGEQLETVLFEGVPARGRALRQRIRRVGKRRISRNSRAWTVLTSMVSLSLVIIIIALNSSLSNETSTDATAGYVLLGAVLLALALALAVWLVLYRRARRREVDRDRDRAV